MPGYGNYRTPFTNCHSARLVELQSWPYRPSAIRLQSTSPRWKVPSVHNKLHLGGKEPFSSYPFEQGIFQGYSNVESICCSMERAIFLLIPGLPFSPTCSNELMQLMQLGLEVFLVVNGFRAGGPLIYSLARPKE